MYEEANRLDMSLCIHTGHPLPSREWDRGFPIMYAFAELVTSKVPEMFPNLRFGFIESGASWIPYVMSQLGATKRAALRGTGTTLPELCDLDPDIFRKNRCFITIDPIDDVESLLKFHTEDNLMIGTDYSHTDISANLSGLNEVRNWVDEGRIDNDQAEKILNTNSRVFYGL